MPIGAPKDISQCRRFFQQPRHPRHRLYEALRAYFLERRPPQLVARAFGYSVGYFHLLCHHFRRDPHPLFFVSPRPGPRSQPKKSAARDLLIRLRKQNYSVYEISHTLKEPGCPLSPTAVREVLREEGFAPLPRRLDEERPGLPPPHHPTGRRRARIFSSPSNFDHPLRRALSLRSRPGAPQFPSAGVEGPPPRFQDDSRPPCLAGLPGSEALVAGAQESRHGAGRRPGLGPVRRAQCHPQEELSVGIFLAPRLHPNYSPAGRLAGAVGGSAALSGGVFQPRFPFHPLLRRGPRGGAPLRVGTQSASTEHLSVSSSRCRGTSFLLFPCRHPERRGIGGGLPLPGVLETRAGRLPPPARV